MFAFVQNSNNFLQNSLLIALKGYLEKPEDFNKSKEEIIELYEEELKKLATEAAAYYEYLEELQSLAEAIQNKRLTSSSLEKFHKRKDVKSIIIRMQSIYEKIKKDEA